MRLALLAFLLAAGARADCSATLKQLTWECDDQCGEYVPCVVHDASEGFECDECYDDDAGECQYECLPVVNYDYSSFWYLIPYGEAALKDPSVAAYEGSGSSNGDAFPSNDNLISIAAMEISPNTTTVCIWAGSNYEHYVQKKFIEVDLAKGLLTNQTQVTYLGVSGLDLHPYETELGSMLPSSLDVLWLINANMSSVGFDIEDAFPNVTDLTLNWNYLQTLSLTHSVLAKFDAQNNLLETLEAITPELVDLDLSYNLLSSLRVDAPKLQNLYLRNNIFETFELSFPELLTLDLANNNLTDLNVSLPNLTSLDLSGNLFTSIPAIVFETAVAEINLTGNPLQSPTFTSSQANFLSKVTLDISNSDFAEQPDCDSKYRVANALFVCIVDDDALTTSSPTMAPTPTPTPTTSTSSSSIAALIIVRAAAGVVLLVALIAALAYHIRRRSKYTGSDTTDTTRTDMTTPETNAPGSLWGDTELCSLLVNPNDIQDIKKLGNGSFGVVWLVRYQNSELLASKRLVSSGNRGEAANRAALEKFVSEIKLVATLDHPRVVRFIGVSWKYYDDLQALFEYMELGDLRECLIKAAAISTPTWDASKLRIAADIVEALVYVHSLAPPIVHRDIKSRNVLLTDKEHEPRAKLTDFGTARNQSTEATMTAGIGTGRWIAPEVLRGSPDYGPQADIYSFGVLLSELDTHAVPYDDVEGSSTGGKRLSNVAILQMVAAGALRPSFRPTCPSMIKDLAASCLAQEPSDRPTAAEVHYALQSTRRTLFGS